MATRPSGQHPPLSWLLILVPLAAFGAVVWLWTAIDAVGAVGPLDRAKLGWLIGLPSTIAVPVVAAWAGGHLRPFGRPGLALLLGIGGAAATAWPLWREYSALCAFVGMPVPVAAIGLAGVISGVTLGGSVIAAGIGLDARRRGLASTALAFLAAGIVFIIGFVVIISLLMSLLFGECVVRPSVTH